LTERHFRSQFHFHRPSEEEIAGKKFDMVIHLVHEGSSGSAVVAVLVKSGGENPAIQKLWANLPKTEGKGEEVANLTFNAADLLPVDRNYYTAPRALNGLCIRRIAHNAPVRSAQQTSQSQFSVPFSRCTGATSMSCV
jgi:carbonic anhydrase